MKRHFQAANWFIKQRKITQALAIYQRMIKRCHRDQQKQIIQNAYSTLDRQEFFQFLHFARTNAEPQYIDNITFELLKKEYLAAKNLGEKQHKALVDQLVPMMNEFKDDVLATIIAWRYFNFRQYHQAIDWFDMAYTWNSMNDDVRYGLMLSLEKTKQYDQLLTVFNRFKKPSERLKEIAARAYKTKAWQAYNQGDYKSAQKYADKSRQLSGDDIEIEALNAWITSKQGRHKASARLFEHLYQKTGKRIYAKSYVLEQAKADKSVLPAKARQLGGAILEEYKIFTGREFYNRKLFLSAYKIAPAEFPDLVNINSPFFQVGGGFRSKSGIAGTSRLDITKLPAFTAAYTFNGDQVVSFNVSRISLYSGGLSACNTEMGVFLGKKAIKDRFGLSKKLTDFYIEGICKAVGFHLDKQHLSEAVELNISYKKDGWFSPFISVGSTPIGGAVSPLPTFSVGFNQQAGFGYWGVESYSRSVRQSILSYTGIQAPYVKDVTEENKKLIQQFLQSPFVNNNFTQNEKNTIQSKLSSPYTQFISNYIASKKGKDVIQKSLHLT